MLADLTSQGETPGQWSARVGAAFRRFNANRVVAEINNGGEMVGEVLRQSDPNLPVRTVTATRGKFLRAEPVAAAYERGIVFHRRRVREARGSALHADARISTRAPPAFRPTAPTRWSGRSPICIAPRRASRATMLDYLRARDEGRMRLSARLRRRRDGVQGVAELAVELGGGELRVDDVGLVVVAAPGIARRRRATPRALQPRCEIRLQPLALAARRRTRR